MNEEKEWMRIKFRRGKTISRFSFGKASASVGHLRCFSVESRKFSKREALTAG